MDFSISNKSVGLKFSDNKEIKSFGDKSLSDQFSQVQEKLKKFAPVKRKFGRDHTQFMWSHLNLCWSSPAMNYREITAQIIDRERALETNKYSIMKDRAKIAILQEKLKEATGAKRDLIEIQIAEKNFQLKQGLPYVEGCLKDIQVLLHYHDQLLETFKSFTEDELEKMEVDAHLQRALMQSITDMRETDKISKGDQEYLERIGVNPGVIIKDLRKYLLSEAESKDATIKPLYDFVAQFAEHLAEVSSVRMSVIGLKETILPEYLFEGEPSDF